MTGLLFEKNKLEKNELQTKTFSKGSTYLRKEYYSERNPLHCEWINKVQKKNCT